MGVGKGTIARAMVKEYNLVAIDTDDIIESMENKSIKEIFESKGEEYFRQKEQEVALWLQNCVKNTLISTGGGFFMVKNLNKIGKVVYLKSSFESIYDRITKHKNAKEKIAKRPLFKDKEKLHELYKKRVKLYEKKADIIVNVDERKTKDIIKEIKNSWVYSI